MTRDPDPLPIVTNGPGPLALLVEPDDDTRELYAFALGQDHWKVAQAQNGAEAFERVVTLHPDVVVSELRLPHVDGYQLCERLRGDPATQQIPIVIVTASAFPADMQRAAAAGSDIVLPKPCSPLVLVELMRTFLQQPRRKDRRGGSPASNEGQM